MTGLRNFYRFGVALAVFFLVPGPGYAAPPEIVIEIRNHLFEPDIVEIPANTKVKLVIYNRDPSPEEFESYELNREKVIMGGRKAIVFVGPLEPGEYPFFGEFNPKTAQGKVVAKEVSDVSD